MQRSLVRAPNKLDRNKSVRLWHSKMESSWLSRCKSGIKQKGSTDTRTVPRKGEPLSKPGWSIPRSEKRKMMQIRALWRRHLQWAKLLLSWWARQRNRKYREGGNKMIYFPAWPFIYGYHSNLHSDLRTGRVLVSIYIIGKARVVSRAPTVDHTRDSDEQRMMWCVSYAALSWQSWMAARSRLGSS